MRLSLPLTAAQNRRQANGESSLVEILASRTLPFPLPIRLGDGRGEGRVRGEFADDCWRFERVVALPDPKNYVFPCRINSFASFACSRVR